MCNNCNQPTCYGNCGCTTCVDSCPIKLDFECVLYNMEGKNASNLTGLNLPNGSTLKLVVELLDQKIRQLNVINYALPILRSNHTVANLQNFSESVDTEIGEIKQSVIALSNLSNVSILANDSSTIHFSTSGTLDHTITANVKIGLPDSSNCLVSQADGLVAVPQTLSINYATKQLSISKGNTINLTGLVSSTYLGNLSNDPTGAVDGNYWYNQTENKLKIKVNSVVKQILTN